MRIILERFCYSDDGTFGKIIMPDGSTLASVERPWLDNLPNISCIPEGDYNCKPRYYYRGGYPAFEVINVIDRSYILFHKGNFVRNSQGCILVNSYHGAHRNEWCGWASANAWDHFTEQLDNKKFTLGITNTLNA